jgi:hypothetical protein
MCRLPSLRNGGGGIMWDKYSRIKAKHDGKADDHGKQKNRGTEDAIVIERGRRWRTAEITGYKHNVYPNVLSRVKYRHKSN